MRRTGAWLAIRALEQLGIRYTFGIPGVHNTELYDELESSEAITPVLVTHEGCGAFMADAVSRTTDSVGCLVIVPAAGLTHAMSGIGEAFLDGIPMLVISGGIRRDSGRAYQLHDIDQLRLVDGIVKAAFRVQRHDEVMDRIHEAHRIATSGEPGPVFVELAGDVLMFDREIDALPPPPVPEAPRAPDSAAVAEAAQLLAAARRPGIYVGWGSRDASAPLVRIAERLGAPVATTLQGLSVFPHDHPLHVGMGYGRSAVPAARNAFRGCDALLAVGVRFAELATGSYGMDVPDDLVHVDINPEVFGRNYPPKVALAADASVALAALEAALDAVGLDADDDGALRQRIARDKGEWIASWSQRDGAERVGPGPFFSALRGALERDAYVVVDDGNHTFLTAELFPVYRSRHLISPTDFNCMGYCVPATIAVKLAHPDAQVVAIVGDGAFAMTALEIVTATSLGLGAIFFVFNDGELAQISQLQQIPLARKTCTVLPGVEVEGVARATGAAYLAMRGDEEIGQRIDEALKIAVSGRPVIVDVAIDYSRKSAFTTGIVKTNLGRFPLRQKARFIGRALKRHLVG